ncbi:MAG: triose-phosphate isomerase [Eubacteriales bacterium]|nr:triose-phosphate isomerase [Eubacteriales bacterium]
MRELRKPYFETGVKCYLYGEKEMEFARKCEAVAVKYDIDVLFISSFMNMKDIARECPHLFVIAQAVDNWGPGRGMGKIIPEALKEAGAWGACINHCERPMALTDIKGTIDKLRACGLKSFVCADSTDEAMAIANLHPDIMNPEPSELIGSGQAPDMAYVTKTVKAVNAIDPSIITEIAAGISTAQDVYDFIMAGSDAAGAASGIIKSDHPDELLDEMVAAVRRAKDDLEKK